ncbi:MAG: PRC-barrel domain-containing protein [Sulfuricaulis sp.]
MASQHETPGRVGGGQSCNKKAGPSLCITPVDLVVADTMINSNGDVLGKANVIMLDAPGGRIAYALLSFGGLLGMPNKLFAIPREALTKCVQCECFTLDVDKSRLRDAPGFDKYNRPAMNDLKWVANIHFMVKRLIWNWPRLMFPDTQFTMTI